MTKYVEHRQPAARRVAFRVITVLLDEGAGVRLEMAERFGVSPPTISRAIRFMRTDLGLATPLTRGRGVTSDYCKPCKYRLSTTDRLRIRHAREMTVAEIEDSAGSDVLGVALEAMP